MNVEYTADAFVDAAAHGDKVVVELFLVSGMSPDARRASDNWSALIASTGAGHEDVVRLLLDWGADPSGRGRYSTVGSIQGHDPDELQWRFWINGVAPLAVASAHGYSEIAAELLQSGASVDNEIQAEASAFGGSFSDERLRIAGATELVLALLMNHEQTAKLLIRAGSDPNAVVVVREEQDGYARPQTMSAIVIAAMSVSEASVSSLISAGADFEQQVVALRAAEGKAEYRDNEGFKAVVQLLTQVIVERSQR